MQAIEHGQKLYYRDKHYDSLLPSMALADAKNSRRTQNSDHFYDEEGFQPFRELAFTGEKKQIDPKALACFAKASSSGFLPRWIADIAPMSQWVNAGLASNDPVPEQYAFISSNLAIFHPVVRDGWIVAPLAVFKAGDGDVTLIDYESEESVATVKVSETEPGYATNMRLQIVEAD